MAQKNNIRNFEENDLADMLTIFNRFAKESFAVYCDYELQFEEVGSFKNVAVKFGELIDIVWVQKQLGDQ